VYVLATGASIAAAVLVAVWAFRTPPAPTPDTVNRPADVARSSPTDAEPAGRPRRITGELAKASQALLDSAKPLTDPAVAAPRVFAAIPNPFAVSAPVPNFEPARRSLADLPDAARAGLEPVAESAARAFARLVRDVSAVKPKS
jgi:hypothetical protein